MIAKYQTPFKPMVANSLLSFFNIEKEAFVNSHMKSFSESVYELFAQNKTIQVPIGLRLITTGTFHSGDLIIEGSENLYLYLGESPDGKTTVHVIYVLVGYGQGNTLLIDKNNSARATLDPDYIVYRTPIIKNESF